MNEITEYYTAGAAMAVLDVTYNQLITFVENGNIRTYQPAGKKRRVYHKEDVDNLARLRQERERIRIIDKEDLPYESNSYPGTVDRKGSSAYLASGRYHGKALD